VGFMKAVEIILITLFVMVGFLGIEFIVSHIGLTSAMQLFFIRICFQMQYILLVYLLFDSRESVRRIRSLEMDIDNLKQVKTGESSPAELREGEVPEGRR
jgi:hypothetical protein